VSFGLLVTLLLILFTDADRKPFALVMFGSASFLIASVAQEMYRGTSARRAMTHDLWPLAFVALIRRNRRRYGGYIAHLGLAVLLIGVAASSSFQHSRNATLRPGQSVSVDGNIFHYVRPTAVVTSEKISFGAVIDVTKNGKQVALLHTDQGFYPSTNTAQDGIIGRFFDSSNADSTIGLDAGPLRDIWTVAAANLQPLLPLINKGNKLLAAEYNGFVSQALKLPKAEQSSALNADLNQAQYWTARDLLVQEIAAQYTKHAYPIQFLLIISPLVSWLWVGAIILAIGGLIAMWPAPLAIRRRSLSVYRSRVAREIS
jgi:cytochrome c-type biogenesis protein CcmF